MVEKVPSGESERPSASWTLPAPADGLRLIFAGDLHGQKRSEAGDFGIPLELVVELVEDSEVLEAADNWMVLRGDGDVGSKDFVLAVGPAVAGPQQLEDDVNVLRLFRANRPVQAGDAAAALRQADKSFLPPRVGVHPLPSFREKQHGAVALGQQLRSFRPIGIGERSGHFEAGNFGQRLCEELLARDVFMRARRMAVRPLRDEQQPLGFGIFRHGNDGEE